MASPILLRRLLGCAAAAWLLASAHTAAAQLPDFGDKLGSRLLGGLGGGDEEKVAVEAEFTAPQGDGPGMLFVTANVAPGYHVSAVDQGEAADGSGGPKATVITIDGNKRVKLLGPFQSIQPPSTRIDKLAWVGLELREHAGEVTWYAPLEIAPGVDPENLAIKGALEGQACDENSCIPVELSFNAKLGEGMPVPTPQQSVQELPASRTSLWTIAGYGILGGLILNLMPCVLPVIGLKIFSFAKQGGQSRAHVLGLNVAYSAGLLAVFMVLATLAAGVQLGISDTSYGWGQIYTLTWFKVTMTALVFAMALSFLGVWEIPIPGFATSGKATALAAQEGMFGAFCMGVITTLLAVPCSGPFLGPVLGYTISQPPSVTYLVFASIGLGMAMPYLLIGAFPPLVSWLPKPGAWMDTLKNLMGFALLATVVYLFSTLNHDYFIATLALLVGIWFACWIVGRIPAYAEANVRFRSWATAFMAAAIVGVGSFQFLTPSKSPLPWQPYSPQALAVARAQGKTVLVDFTADWCLTCKVNLAFAINRKEVKDLVERNGVVTLLADWTDNNDVIKKALLELNSQSIPLLAIYPADPNREVMILPDVLTQGTVLDALVEAGPSLDEEAAKVADDQAAADAPLAPEFGAIARPTTKR